MGWKKSGKPLSPSRYGRVILHTTLNKREDWFTALVIRDLKESDSGDYTFSVKTGPVVSSVTRSLVVLPKQGQFIFTDKSALRAEFSVSHRKTTEIPYCDVDVQSLTREASPIGCWLVLFCFFRAKIQQTTNQQPRKLCCSLLDSTGPVHAP